MADSKNKKQTGEIYTAKRECIQNNIQNSHIREIVFVDSPNDPGEEAVWESGGVASIDLRQRPESSRSNRW